MPETDIPGRFLDDLSVGDRFQSSTYEVTEANIVAFAQEFDPQPFHLDVAEAEKSLFRGLAASGWHTAGITMRLFVTSELRFGGGAVGLGVDELRWPQPVRPGDTLTAEMEIVEIRVSRSRPDRGVVRIRITTKNQRGTIVQSMIANALVPRRPRKEGRT